MRKSLAVSTRLPDLTSYAALLRLVKDTLLKGQRRIEAEKIRTYWKTGRLIQDYILQNKSRAGYGEEAIARLANDLVLNKRLLYYCLQFAQKYPKIPIVNGRSQFKWSHYRELIKIPDDKERLRLEGLVAKNEWSAEELGARLKVGSSSSQLEKTSSTPGVGEVLALRGELYTYRIIRPKTVSTQSPLVVDLGFEVTRNVEPRLLAAFSEGDIVVSLPKEDAYLFTKSDRTAKSLYTYQAFVEKVVDGDTLNVRIDLGFGTWVRQTLRLRGIDCPEVGSKEGDQAKVFVQSLVKEADRITIRSSRSDKYDRYLADVFIPHAGGEDIFLNGLLLEKSLARRAG